MEKLNYMAFRDGLTGLYNRRYVVGDLLEDIRGFQQSEQNLQCDEFWRYRRF